VRIRFGDGSRKRRIVYAATVALLAAGVPVMHSPTWRGSAQLHTLMELSATLVALLVGILALVRFYSRKDNTFLFIGTGFVGTGLVDGYHAVVSSPAFIQYFPSPPPSLIPWSGFASRLFLSVLLLLSWALWKREERLGEPGRVPEFRVYLAVSILTLACFFFFVLVPLPVGYRGGPIFQRPQELLPTLLYVLAAAGYLRKGRWKRDPFEHWLILAIILCAGQSVYISTSDRLYDTIYMASHGLKLLSYLGALTGLVVGMYHLFLQEESIVAERTEKLQEEIVERKRAQEESLALLHREQAMAAKMREERAFSEAVIQLLPAMVYIFNGGRRFQRWNTRLETTLGYSSWEIPRLALMEVIAEEDREQIERKVQQVFEEGSAEAEASVIRKDGAKVPCYMSGVRITLDDKPCVLGAAIDISERKRAEAELRESEARLKLIMDSVLTGVVIIDPATHRITDANPVALRLIGLPREQVAGAECHKFICPAEKGRCPITDLGQTVDNSERLLLTATGEQRAVLKTVVRVVIGGREQLLESFVDISARKRAEEQVRLQATALQSAANAIVITDSKGTIQWVNRAFTALTGYSLEEAAGQNPRILKSGKHDEAFYKNLWGTITAGEVWTGELTNRRKDGQLYVDQMTIAPVISAGGEITNFVAIKQDSTDRKRMEAEMMSAKELAESANRAKSEFLANMSHELRTPLNGIMGMTELALDTALTAEQREYLSMAKTSADSLLALINDILDFSKIEAGKLDFETIEFELRTSLETTLKTLAPRAHEKGLELNCDIAPEVPEFLVGDPTRLRQVVVNLVGNAIKFTEQGQVTVSVGVESAGALQAVLRFDVADTGIGIPTDRQQQIFEAFVQGDGSTTRRYGGSGLGLAVSRRLVQMFGGRIWLDSQPGIGSTFHFTARFGIGNHREKISPLPIAKLGGLPVLVVADNPTNRRILEQMLTGWHMKPTLAGETRSALSILQEAAGRGAAFPLVLVDSIMPDIDGFMLAKQIKDDPRLATATVLMLTSAGHCGEAARCRELGVAAYLTKPIGQSELLKVILQVMGTKAAGVEPQATLVTRHSVREHSRGLRILLAEDNLVNRMLAVRMLEKYGHAVEVAQDGGEALRKYEAGRFDLVLMDVQMPEIDGFEATAAIRGMEKKKGGHVPIVAMTAHALTGDRERCLAVGMDGYISKPFQVEDLLKEMERIEEITGVQSR
jgi:PAS domain S-box-containing protein